MNVMVTGSRDWRDIKIIKDALAWVDENWTGPHTLIHGCASGADAIARALAKKRGWSAKDVWPQYDAFPFAEANKLRNIEMIDLKPDLILAFPTRGSRGTWHAVSAAKKAGYVEGANLFLYSEQREFRQTKDLADFPR